MKIKDGAFGVMDMMLAKKRAPDRRQWLEKNGNLSIRDEVL